MTGKNKMKIALVTSMKNIGGTEKATKRFASLLIKNNHQVYLFSSKGPLVEATIEEGVIWSEFDFYPKYSVALLPLLIKLVVFLRKNKIDVVHCQMARPVLLVWLACNLQNYSIRVIWHSRGLPARTYPIVSRLFSRLGIYAIGNCRHEQKKLIRHGYNKKLVNYLYNPLPQLNMAYKKKQSNIITIGTMSRLEKSRSINKAILIFKEVLADNLNVRLLIAGEGSEKKSLERLVEKHGLKNHVEFLGEIKDQIKFYSRVDIYINTFTAYGDNWAGVGNTQIESGLYKIPVVSFNACGISEIIIDGKTGFCVEAGNSEKFIKRINVLLKDDNLSIRLANNLNSHVKKVCSSNVIYRSIMRSYEE